MIEGKKIKLVPYEPEFWPFIERWNSDSDYKFYFRNMPDIYNKAQLMSFPQIMGMNVLMIYVKDIDRVIGLASWDNVRILARTCDIGFIVEKEFQRGGYSRDVFMHFCDHLFNRMGFHKISASVIRDDGKVNEKSIHVGLKEPVIIRENCFIDGSWHDEVKYSLIDREFNEMFQKYLKGEKIWAEEKVAAVVALPVVKRSVIY